MARLLFLLAVALATVPVLAANDYRYRDTEVSPITSKACCCNEIAALAKHSAITPSVHADISGAGQFTAASEARPASDFPISGSAHKRHNSAETVGRVTPGLLLADRNAGNDPEPEIAFVSHEQRTCTAAGCHVESHAVQAPQAGVRVGGAQGARGRKPVRNLLGRFRRGGCGS